MEKLRIRRLSTQAKILGAIISIAGALVVVLFRGPAVIRTYRASVLDYHPLTSAQSNWIIGGVLLIADYFVLSLWYTVQVKIKVFFFSLSFVAPRKGTKEIFYEFKIASVGFILN